MKAVIKLLNDKIDSLEELGFNWDGYGGIAVLPEVALNAKKFIAALDPRLVKQVSDMFPNSHGTISIDWENENHEKVGLEIGKDNFSFFVRLKSGPLFFDEQDFVKDIQVVSFHIEKIVGEKL